MSVSRLLLALSLFVGVIAVGRGAGVIDLIKKEFDVKSVLSMIQARSEQTSTTSTTANNRNCLCKGPSCVCCVDFNVTFVDLGGPGCVHMKYLSPEDGFAINVSYGKNLVHTSKIQGSNPQPICLDMFGKLAQLCAKFSDLAPTSEGLRGCLDLEPRLLGETQLDFPLGCFKSTSGGLEMEEPPVSEATNEEGKPDTEEENGEDSEAGIDSEFLQGIYQTAEQGVAFLSSLFDLPNKINSKPTTTNSTTAAPQTNVEEASQRRAPKNLKHPNQL